MKKRNYYLVLSIIIFSNAIAYYLCLDSMKVMNGFDSPFTRLLHEINIIANSLVFPLMLLLIICIFKNIFLILILHFFNLGILLISSIYYKYFQSTPHVNLINQIYTLPYIANQIFSQLFGINELVISGCIFLSLGLSFRLSNDIKKNRFNTISKKKLLILFLVMLTVYSAKGIWINSVRPLHIQREWERDDVRALRHHGFIVVYLDQFMREMFKEKKTIPYPGKINLNTQNVTLRDKNKKNVIVLQVETFDNRIIDYRVGSKYVTPYLNQLKKQGIFFKHFFAQCRGGGSSDVELSSLISLIPLKTHSGLRTADYNKIVSLNKALAKEGYYCVGIHANTGRFFNRIQSYAMMGFDKFFDQEAFHAEARGWLSKDKAFFEQTVEILRSLPQPFFAYIITMQSHGPFTNYSINPNSFDLSGFNKDLQHYMLTMHEVDQAISVFMNRLDKYNFLKNTAIIIYGDSSTSFNFPKSDKNDIWHIAPKNCHVPLFILNSGIPASLNYKVGSHIDIGPTILDMLGIEEPHGWLGSSLLQPGAGKAVLNYGQPYVLVNQGDTVIRDHNYQTYFEFIDYSASMLDP